MSSTNRTINKREKTDYYVTPKVDIRPDSKAEIKANYLTYYLINDHNNQKPDIIISNPPFMHAKAFIQKALHDVATGGYVVMLLRLNFLGSKARKQFFENHMPERIYVHHKRMSFTSDNKTDSIEYAHFVWKKGFNPEKSLLKVL